MNKEYLQQLKYNRISNEEQIFHYFRTLDLSNCKYYYNDVVSGVMFYFDTFKIFQHKHGTIYIDVYVNSLLQFKLSRVVYLECNGYYFGRCEMYPFTGDKKSYITPDKFKLYDKNGNHNLDLLKI